MSTNSVMREALQSYADLAPSNAGLLDRVRSRSRRWRIRRNALAGVTAVVAAAGLAAAGTLYGGAGGDGTAPPAAPPPVRLAEPSYDLPSFPFSPGWTPDGLELPYVFYHAGLAPQSSLAVPDGRVRFSQGPQEEWHPRLSRLRMLQVAADPVLPSPLWASIYENDPTAWLESISEDERDLRVQGRPATSYEVNDIDVIVGTIVAWRHEPGQWVTVTADHSLAPEDAVRYARGLTEEPTPAAVPFEFELLPADMDLSFTSFGNMDFADAHEGWLTVVLWPERAWAERPSEPADDRVEVGGRQADLQTGANGIGAVHPTRRGPGAGGPGHPEPP